MLLITVGVVTGDALNTTDPSLSSTSSAEGVAEAFTLGLFEGNGVLGSVEGLAEGNPEGAADGLELGRPEGIVDGNLDGDIDSTKVGGDEATTDGMKLGSEDGIPVGVFVEGELDGIEEGSSVGFLEGTLDGRSEGISLGVLEGWSLGVLDGVAVVGESVGDPDGNWVGSFDPWMRQFNNDSCINPAPVSQLLILLLVAVAFAHVLEQLAMIHVSTGDS